MKIKVDLSKLPPDLIHRLTEQRLAAEAKLKEQKGA